MGNEFLRNTIRNELHLCGCGEYQSEQAVFLIRDILKTVDDDDAEGYIFDRVTALAGNPGSAYIALTCMHEADLIEYGGRITNPMVTEKGTRFADEVSRFPDEESLADMIDEWEESD